MALIEDVAKGTVFEKLGAGNMLATAGMAALALALPLAVPSLRPALRAAAKAGLTLFFESEGELEGEIIGMLVKETMSELTSILSEPASEAARTQAVHRTVGSFKRKARARARRWRWDEADEKARYRRQLSRLDRAVSHRRDREAGTNAALLRQASEAIAEDW
jgi:hypothetical protein